MNSLNTFNPLNRIEIKGSIISRRGYPPRAIKDSSSKIYKTTVNYGKALNPLGPHALRESFDSTMINSGVPDTIVDFWLGHTIGEMAEAYKGVQLESLKQIYQERENLISIMTSQVDIAKIETKLKVQFDERKNYRT